ncbi:UNVERIFIED_CONTAM: hypothetical protein Slati_1880600 [Sesamum latifolium]|uniref:Uncharacterized protein n=1 Tax=Sesamum latifolium TaxID=2727402 RepID=A0AAW2X435_9LAMI
MAGNEAHRTAGPNPAGGARQRWSMPYSPYTMAAAGLAVAGGLWYMYGRRKPEARHLDVPRAPAGAADPADTRQRK